MIGVHPSQQLQVQAEEAAILWELRQRWVARPTCPMALLLRMDRRVRAHLWGLVAAGERGWVMAQQQDQDPGEVFVRVFLALHERSDQRLELLLESMAAAPALVGPALRWFQPASMAERAGWLTRRLPEELQVEVLAALQACAVGEQPAVPRQTPSERRRQAFPGRHNWRAALVRYAARASYPQLRELVVSIIETKGPCEESVDAVAISLLPELVDWLLDVMATCGALCRQAGLALRLITGLEENPPYFETPLEDDDPDPWNPAADDLTVPCPKFIMAWWGARLEQAAFQGRTLLGRPLTTSHAQDEAGRGILLSRVLAAEQLRADLGWPWLDPSAPVQHQRRTLVTLRKRACSERAL